MVAVYDRLDLLYWLFSCSGCKKCQCEIKSDWICCAFKGVTTKTNALHKQHYWYMTPLRLRFSFAVKSTRSRDYMPATVTLINPHLCSTGVWWNIQSSPQELLSVTDLRMTFSLMKFRLTRSKLRKRTTQNINIQNDILLSFTINHLRCDPIYFTGKIHLKIFKRDLFHLSCCRHHLVTTVLGIS